MIGKHTPRGQGGNKVDSSLSTPRSPIDLKEPASHLVSPSKPWPDANKAKMRSLQFQNNHMSLWGKSGWVYFLFSIYPCLDMLHFSVFSPKKNLLHVSRREEILLNSRFGMDKPDNQSGINFERSKMWGQMTGQSYWKKKNIFSHTKSVTTLKLLGSLWVSDAYNYLMHLRSPTCPNFKYTCTVIVNFVCQCGCAMVPRYLIKHYSGCFCKGVYGAKLII